MSALSSLYLHIAHVFFSSKCSHCISIAAIGTLSALSTQIDSLPTAVNCSLGRCNPCKKKRHQKFAPQKNPPPRCSKLPLLCSPSFATVAWWCPCRTGEIIYLFVQQPHQIVLALCAPQPYPCHTQRTSGDLHFLCTFSKHSHARSVSPRCLNVPWMRIPVPHQTPVRPLCNKIKQKVKKASADWIAEAKATKSEISSG